MEKIKVLDKMTPHETCWVPVVWAIRLLTSAHEDDKNMRRLESPVFANLLSAIDKIEANNRKLLNYGWVNFPLAYTQVWNYYDFTTPFPNTIIKFKYNSLLLFLSKIAYFSYLGRYTCCFCVLFFSIIWKAISTTVSFQQWCQFHKCYNSLLLRASFWYAYPRCEDSNSYTCGVALLHGLDKSCWDITKSFWRWWRRFQRKLLNR